MPGPVVRPLQLSNTRSVVWYKAIKHVLQLLWRVMSDEGGPMERGLAALEKAKPFYDAGRTKEAAELYKVPPSNCNAFLWQPKQCNNAIKYYCSSIHTFSWL